MKFLSALPFAFLVPQILATTSTTIVQPTPVPELSDITWKSDSTGFDAAKVQPVNASTYDWWYFDAIQVSDDPAQQASVVITFYTAVPSGFDFLQPYAAQGFTSLTLTDVLIHWPNGTAESYFFNATEARITTNTADNGVHGAWIENPDKISFMGSPDMTTWQVELDSEAWISGTVTLQSIAPPHLPCGPLASGKNMQVAPHVGWSNAVPDAQANVQLNVNGRPLNFTGIGYHDKNWGDKNFVASVGSWYWGHGRLGPYSVVWFDFLSPERENFVSAYVARGNEILVSQSSGITVRPYGENSTYPPLASTGNPSGFDINIELPDGNHLDFKAAADRMIAGGAPESMYARFTGTLEGTVDGEALTGDALFEHFHIFEK